MLKYLLVEPAAVTKSHALTCGQPEDLCPWAWTWADTHLYVWWGLHIFSPSIPSSISPSLPPSFPSFFPFFPCRAHNNANYIPCPEKSWVLFMHFPFITKSLKTKASVKTEVWIPGGRLVWGGEVPLWTGSCRDAWGPFRMKGTRLKFREVCTETQIWELPNILLWKCFLKLWLIMHELVSYFTSSFPLFLCVCEWNR